MRLPGSLDVTNAGSRSDAGYRFGDFNGGAFIEALATISVWADARSRLLRQSMDAGPVKGMSFCGARAMICKAAVVTAAVATILAACIFGVECSIRLPTSSFAAFKAAPAPEETSSIKARPSKATAELR